MEENRTLEAMDEQSTVEGTTTEGRQALEDNSSKIQSQQDSAYGSLECSSQGQSQKSYNGSGTGSVRAKSLNSQSSFSTGLSNAKSMISQSSFSTGISNTKSRISSSSRSSGFGHDFRLCMGVCMKEGKHKDHKKKKVKDKSDKFKEKDKQEKVLAVKEEPDCETAGARSETCHQEDAQPQGHSGHSGHGRKSPIEEKPHSHCDSLNSLDSNADQPSLVYTQALNYIRKIKERSAEQGVPFASPNLIPTPSEKPEKIPLLKGISPKEGFSLAISMNDGSVLEVTPGVTDVIGYPMDMLLGQSFIDFVYPKDSINFYSKIIHGLRTPFGKETIKDSEYGTSFYCRLRVYHSLRQSGFGIRNKKIEYKPCRINLKILQTQKEPSKPAVLDTQSKILVEIIPIEKAYKVPEESLPSAEPFTIRHSVSCNFSEYSPESIPYLGHLPQDLTGNSIFDCYHPEDLPRMKMIYCQVVKEQGKPYRSPPYRFKTFNNSWVTLETEWLCFVNPWTKKIDSIIGQHRVVKGPRDINIFTNPTERLKTPLPDDIIKESQRAQADILDLLSQPVASYRDPCREPTEKRRRTLVDLMSPFVDHLDNMEKNNEASPFREEFRTILSGRRHLSTVQRPATDLTTLGAGGGLDGNNTSSPQHEEKGCESNTRSSHTPSPLSYTNLNFTHTLERFFKSDPKIMSSDESGDSKMDVFNPESTDEGKSSSPFPQSASESNNRKFQSQSQSGSGSGDNIYNSASTGNMSGESGSGENRRGNSSGRHSYTHVKLTEEVLSRHNQDMQYRFMESQRKSNKGRNPGQRSKHRKSAKKNQGIKRSANFMEQESLPPKHRYLTPSVCSAGSFKRSKSKLFNPQVSNCASKPRTAAQTENRHNSTIPRPSLVDSVGQGNSNATFPNLLPSYYLPSTTPESAPGPANINSNNNSGNNKGNLLNNNCPPHLPLPRPQGYNPMSPFMVSPHQSFIPSQGVAVPFPYVSTFPGVFYQPVAPPLFNAPPVMLPNMVFQHTVVQPPNNGQVSSVPFSSDGRRSGIDSDLEMQSSPPISKMRKSPSGTVRRPDSQATSVKADVGSMKGSITSVCGRHISSNSNVPDCCRSYAVDIRPLACNPPPTSILVEAESVGSPEKEKSKIEDAMPAGYTSSDMIMSLISSNGDKSSDDSLNNISEITESNQFMSSVPKWNQPRWNAPKPVLSEPPWLDNIDITPELLYRYQLQTKELVDVLRRDMDVLKKTKQSALVEDQLASLYKELEIDGDSPDLHLSEGITSSSSGEDQPDYSNEKERKSKKHSTMYYSKIAMIHEEDAPFPPIDNEDSLSSSS